MLLAPGKAKDYSILSTIIELLGSVDVNKNLNMISAESYNTVKDSYFLNFDYHCGFTGKLSNKFLVSSQINNFYLSDPISEASPTMAKCSKQLLLKNPFLI